jgi:hypothetical protein
MPVRRPANEVENAADRAAVEQIMGRPLPPVWPAGAAAAGARVRVVKDARWDGPWRREFLGTVDDLGAPELNVHQHAWPGELKYWVRFDEPEFDAAGDGPYRKAQIWSRYLRLVEECDDPRP